MKKNKIAVVIYNLGGPGKLSDVKKYLFNLFYDVVTIPNPFKWIISKIIAYKREKTAIEIYQYLGGKSPIFEETLNQQKHLQNLLNEEKKNIYKVFTAMQCWKPSFSDLLPKIKEFSPDKIVTIPLYPQFSSVTTGVSIEKINKYFSIYKDKISNICCYYNEEQFIESYLKKIITEDNVGRLKTRKYRILFSAHGLPQFLINRGDPYQFQIESMVNLLVEKISIDNLDWKISYQSRVGKLKWIEPDTEDEIKKAGKEGKNIIIVPISFVSEHSETLVELDIEYSEIAKKYNIDYVRIPTLRTDNKYIEMLKNLAIKTEKENYSYVSSDNGQRKCPYDFKLCKCK